MKFASLVALVNIAQAGPNDEAPPTTGRFFYTDMRSETGEHKEGTHVIEALISNEKKHFSLGLNTQRYSLSVVSDTCPTDMCQVPQVYYPGDSSSLTMPNVRDNLDNSAFIESNHNLISTDLSAVAVQDTLMLQIDQYDREIRSDFVFESITDSSERYSDNYDGFIGIAPPQQHRSKKEANFLQQLQDKHFIDHQVVMINSNVKDGNSSVIKFGSWDPSVLAPGAQLTTLRTTNAKNWVLNSSTMKLNGVEFLSGVDKDIEISPHLPYLYIPDGEWSHFAFQMDQVFGDTVNCEWQDNYCRFDFGCDTYKARNYGDMPFEIEVKDDEGGNYPFNVKLADHLVDGDNFGQTTGQYCYIPLFRSYHLSLQNTWFLGSIFMDDYVFVFDNTPYTERQQDFMTISIGAKNKDATQQGVEAQYNSASPNYAPSQEDTTTDATIPMIEEAPVEDDSDPVDIPPMTDGGVIAKTETSSDAQVDIDPEFKDPVAPKFDANAPPAPGLSLEYMYYLWTQVGNIMSFFTSTLNMIMSMYHKVLG